MSIPGIRIYCGEGKGKTSAALGNAFKSLNGDDVAYVLQFIKDEEETELLRRFEPEIKVFHFDRDTAVNFAKKALTSRECDIMILDEVFVLVDEKPNGETDILEIMDLAKKNSIKLLLTGPNVTDKIAEKADHITELSYRK